MHGITARQLNPAGASKMHWAAGRGSSGQGDFYLLPTSNKSSPTMGLFDSAAAPLSPMEAFLLVLITASAL